MTYVYSFLVGGLLCVFAQILIDKMGAAYAFQPRQFLRR